MTDPQSPSPALAQLVGQWRLLSFDLEVRKTGQKAPAWGPNPRGRLIVLPNAFMMVVLTGSDRPVPLTDEQRATAFKYTIAYSGPVTIEGDQMKVKVDVSWHEAWINTVQARTFKLDGSKLSLVSAWAPSPADPDSVVRGILEWTREA